MPGMVDTRFLEEIVTHAPTKAEGCRRLHQFVAEGLQQKKFTSDQISIRGIGFITGAIDPHDLEGSLRAAGSESIDSSRMRYERIFSESNPGLSSNAFQVITGELISSAVIEGYNNTDGLIGDQLVRVVPVKMRNTKIAGFSAIGGPLEVKEGMPYEETGFDEKYITTRESKKGRIVSLNEELVLFDQTGMVRENAMELGIQCRHERERTIVRGAIDADASTSPVYRPSGTGESLYATDGSNFNYIGVGNTTAGSAFQAASALQDWTDLDLVRRYRATEVKDDRIDGTQRAITGINTGLTLLVPESLVGVADMIVNATEIRRDGTNERTTAASPVRGMVNRILSSPVLDEVSVADYYLGNFQRQFIWTEIWPIQTFTQGANSEAAFERDTIFRYKVRYYGGISAKDSRYVTKIDGA